MPRAMDTPFAAEDVGTLSDSATEEVSEADAPAAPLARARRAVTGRLPPPLLATAAAAALLLAAAAVVAVQQGPGGTLARRGTTGEVHAVTAFREEKGKKTEEDADSDSLNDQDGGGKCAKAFKQCGGADWTGTTCCPQGCACIMENKYFSICKAPHDQGSCNLEAAKKMANRLRAKADPLKETADATAADSKKKHEQASKDKAKFDKAHAAAVAALHKALAAKSDLEKKNKTVITATDEMHRVGKEKDKAVMWWSTVDNENNKGCGDWSGTCQASKCCQHGCSCNPKNAYYSQCGPPAGMKSCNISLAKETATKHAAAATGSKDKNTTDDAKAASKAADARQAKAKEEFEKAEGIYAEAHKAYMKLHEMKEVAEKLKDSSHKAAVLAKRRADKAHANIGQAEVDAEAWEKAVGVEVGI
mmetsp:Transcript_107611/g.299765  ORF Transcript_107611/g.299765 Transcript_107611/m.299765 type:complete len:419 (-) Transcript_107611:142-1398(-)